MTDKLRNLARRIVQLPEFVLTAGVVAGTGLMVAGALYAIAPDVLARALHVVADIYHTIWAAVSADPMVTVLGLAVASVIGICTAAALRAPR